MQGERSCAGCGTGSYGMGSGRPESCWDSCHLLDPWWGHPRRTVLGLHAPLTVQGMPAMGAAAGVLCACTSLSCLVTAALMRYLPLPCMYANGGAAGGDAYACHAQLPFFVAIGYEVVFTLRYLFEWRAFSE